MNPIAQGLALGYSAQKILGFITKAFPALVPRIRQAQSQGHSIENILGFISKTMETPYPKGMSQPEIQAANTKKQETLTKSGLTAIAGIAGSKALAHALPQNLRNAFGVGNPNQQPTAPIHPPNTPQAPHTAQGLNLPGGIGATQQNASNTQNPLQGINPTQQPPLMQHSATNVTQPITNPQQYLEKLGVKDSVDDLLRRGNSPEQAATVLSLKVQKGRKGKTTSEIDPELLANIEDYAKSDKSNESREISPVQEKKSPEIEKLSEERPSISKKDIVAGPQGVGEIKEIRNGQAIFDVDGKFHKVKEDELIQSPIPQKDLAQLYEDLLRGIEEETGEEVSRNVNVAAYDPNTNSLAYIPHDGALYIYDDITPEHKAILENVLKTRKTSGQNHIGAWAEGTKSPIGSQMYELIKELQSQRGGKGKEYARKYEMIYRALSEAEKQHKESKKKKKKQP